MKKLIFILVLGVSTAMFAETPPTVTWQVVTNPVTNGTLPQSADGQGIFGDFNNDGILDFFIITGQGTGSVGLYKGNGDGTFTQVENNELYGKSEASAAFIDFDNDGDLDLFTIGKDDTGNAVTDFFKNTGAPDYNLVWDMDLSDLFPYLSRGGADHNPHAIVVFDYNNDGWSDLLITGYTGGGLWEGNNQARVVALFQNKNDGTFEYIANPIDGTADFEPINGGAVDAADYDHDGWMDILVSGYKDEVGGMTYLYKNNGNGTFSNVPGIEFIGQYQGETAFIDLNNDGYADLVEFGRNLHDNSWSGFSKVFINNKEGGFTRHDETETHIGGVCFVLAVGDINNDGKIDFLTQGWASNNITYYNSGDGIFFTPVEFIPKDGIARQGSTCFADINKDGLLDMHLFGFHDSDGTNDAFGPWPNFFALNQGREGILPNQAPSAPGNVQMTYNTQKNCYDLSWDKSHDDTTPQDAIRYNIYAKYPDGKVNCLVPADIATGMLKVAGLQTFIPVNKYSLYIPETADIEIGVQAIDNGWKGSVFAKFEEGSNIKQAIVENIDVNIVDKSIYISNNNSNNALCRIMTIDGKLLGKMIVGAGGNWSSGKLEPGMYLVETNVGNASQIVKKIVF